MVQALSDFISKVTRGEKVRIGDTEAQWKKVSELTPGLMIAVPDAVHAGAGVKWDEIVSIKRLPPERVWDIEVEGSHNFVANRIFAHNTVGKALFTLNETGDQHILTASASGTTKYNLTRNGLVETADLTLGLNDTSATISTQDTNENLTIDPNGSGSVYFHGSSYYSDSTGNLSFQSYKDFGNESYFLDPAASEATSLNILGNIVLNDTSGGNTISSVSNNNITIDAGSGTVCIGTLGTCAGKLDAGTIDPPYTINGRKYATFAPSMVGVKEEYAGIVRTSEYLPQAGAYRATLDFGQEPEGSELWLFSKVTALKRNMDKLVVLLSPASATRTWYEVDKESMRLSIFTSRPTDVSYRLTGPRYDADQWSHIRGDDASLGHVINDPDEPRAGLTDKGFLDNVAMSVAKETSVNGSPLYTLRDAAGNAINELASYSQATVANLSTGLIQTKDLVTDTIVVKAPEGISIAGQSLRDYVRAVINESLVTSRPSQPQQSSDVLTPVASDSAGIAVKLDDKQTFGIYTKEGTRAAVFDTQGNATFSGTINSSQLTVRDDATVAGTLYADRIVTRFGDIDTLKTTTVSATYITENITNITSVVASPAATLGTTNAAQVARILDIIGRFQKREPDATSSALLSLIQNQHPTTDEHVIIQETQTITLASPLAIDGSLSVLGDTSLGTTAVAGPLLVSGPLRVGSDGLETIGETLYLQNNRLANLDVLAGTLVVNALGEVMINGDLAVSGNVAIGGILGVNTITPIGDNDLTIDLTRYGGTGTESGDLVTRFGKFIIAHEGKAVATIDASGSATFAGDVVASGSGIFRKLVISQSLTESPTTSQSAILLPETTAGSATLLSNTLEVTIANTQVTDSSLIYITPVTSTKNKVLYIKEKVPGVSFTVGIDEPPVASDMIFNWWIIN